jgi:Protein of unknown function (DUF3141)
VFERKTDDTANSDLTHGEWVMRCEQRTLDDIRALGGNDIADEHRFAAADRVSQINLALYRTFMQPFVRACATPQFADLTRQMHPLRLQYELCSNANPLMAPLAAMAERARKNRKPVAADNPFLALQENFSRQIVAALDAWRDASEALAERWFMNIYGSPVLQKAVGVEPQAALPLRKAAKSPLHRELMAKRAAELRAKIATGGPHEAVIRALLFAAMGRAAVDERGFEMMRRIREAESDVPLAEFKAIAREQFYMLLIDTEAALQAIPAMLPDDPKLRQKALDLIMQVLSARGEYSSDDRERLARVASLLGADPRSIATENLGRAANENPVQAIAS